ncbi:MAG: putative extracellular protein [Rhodobacteraceae bacterium HLUCCA08]|nr:MAG: putative extracellular protein [Rhodobacteraceae bacterium HLUCCA08]
MRRILATALTLLAFPVAATAGTLVFSATPTDPGSPFAISAAPGSTIPGDSTPFVGNIFGGAGFAISGVENFDGSLASGAKMTSLRFEIYEPDSPARLEGCNTTCVKSTFSLELFNNGVSVNSFSFFPTVNTINGVDVAEGAFVFDQFRVRETTGSNDNEFFANFTATTLAAVPLPASGLLLLAALGGMALRRRRD